MLLAVNIGNTNIRLGLVQGLEVIMSWTLNTKPYKSKDEFYMLLRNIYAQKEIQIADIRGVVIGSVVPHITHEIADALEEIHSLKPMVVDRNTPSGVTHYSNQMGTDLYANTVAAHELYQGDKIIIDFGTALTLTGLAADGEVKGVVIAPGVITSLNALIGNTAQLPDIELVEPKNVLGRDTISCMQSGIVYGYVAMVEGLVNRIKNEMQAPLTVISTGGLGHVFQPLSELIEIDDKLHTIKGLALLYYKNTNQ